jgi:hypothetical protein
VQRAAPRPPSLIDRLTAQVLAVVASSRSVHVASWSDLLKPCVQTAATSLPLAASLREACALDLTLFASPFAHVRARIESESADR